MADECNFDFKVDTSYFKAPDDNTGAKSLSSDMPDGEAWKAKLHYNTVIYALVFASAGVIGLIKLFIEYLVLDMNLYTSTTLLTMLERSVGLPDTRIPEREKTLCERREDVRYRLSKNNIVRLIEMQDRINKTFPDFGIWITTNDVGQSFRYTFRYKFGHNQGSRQRFTILVHIPNFVIDPNNLENSLITWENLQSWMRDFVSGFDLLIPIYEESRSICVITTPEENDIVYIDRDPAGTWFPTTIKWQTIDIDGTVAYYEDTEILDTLENIKRSFTDSTSTLIEASNKVRIVPII